MGITTVSFFSFKKNQFWAFKQMGLAPFQLGSVQGLHFSKFLGTGGGDGFSLAPDFSTYAFLGVWKHLDFFTDCMDQNPVFIKYKAKAFSQRNLILKPIKSHGKWSGKNPFSEFEEKNKVLLKNQKVVVITRATLRWNRLLSFWKSVPLASRSIQSAKGVHFYKGIGEWPFIQQATVSIWDSFNAVNTFAYQDKSHAQIVTQTKKKKWYKEDLFSRFHLISDNTTIINT